MELRVKSAVSCARIDGAVVAILTDESVAILRGCDYKSDGVIGGPFAVLARREEQDAAGGGWDRAFYALGYDVALAGSDRHSRWRDAMRWDALARRELGAALGLDPKPRGPDDPDLARALGRPAGARDLSHERAKREAAAVGISVDGPSLG